MAMLSGGLSSLGASVGGNSLTGDSAGAGLATSEVCSAG